jgi:hypothetical protein
MGVEVGVEGRGGRGRWGADRGLKENDVVVVDETDGVVQPLVPAKAARRESHVTGRWQSEPHGLALRCSRTRLRVTHMGTRLRASALRASSCLGLEKKSPTQGSFSSS